MRGRNGRMAARRAAAAANAAQSPRSHELEGPAVDAGTGPRLADVVTAPSALQSPARAPEGCSFVSTGSQRFGARAPFCRKPSGASAPRGRRCVPRVLPVMKRHTRLDRVAASADADNTSDPCSRFAPQAHGEPHTDRSDARAPRRKLASRRHRDRVARRGAGVPPRRRRASRLPALRHQGDAGAAADRERRRRPLRLRAAGDRARLRLARRHRDARRPRRRHAGARWRRLRRARLRRACAARRGSRIGARGARGRADGAAQQLLGQARRHDRDRDPYGRAAGRLLGARSPGAAAHPRRAVRADRPAARARRARRRRLLGAELGHAAVGDGARRLRAS